MVALELAGMAKALSRPINDIYDGSKARIANKLAQMKTDENIRRIQKRLAAVHKVKTIWQIDREVSLTSFYHPPKLLVGDEAAPVTSLKKLPDGSNIVIQGIVGQGKSTFLRYLCFQEAKTGGSLPIFLELRQLDGGTKLRDLLDEALKSYGIPRSDEVFQYLMDSGKVTLLLDGFDEIPSKLASRTVRELDLLSAEHPDLRIVVTSRPDSGIERSISFRVYKLAPLDRNDREGLISKLVRDSDQAAEILRAIASSETKIDALLRTPLMVTLLVLVYKSQRKIPSQLSDFYEDLFPLLLSRHDKTKPGYIRERKSGASDRTLQKLFEAFCFLTRRADKSILTIKQAVDFAEKAVVAANVSCDASDFVEDITKVSNLMLEEAQRFHFIHKSVQEFHAACYLKDRADAIEDFYKAMIGPKWNSWRQELSFLSQLDPYRYAKFFLIPDLIGFFTSLDINVANGEVSDEALTTVFNGIKVVYVDSSDSMISFGGINLAETRVEHLFYMGVVPRVASGIATHEQLVASKKFKRRQGSNGQNLVTNLFDAAMASSKPNVLFTQARKVIRDLHTDYSRAIAEVAREEGTRELMTF